MQTILSLLPKPSRYLGIEEGSCHKDKTLVQVHIALAFPDMYEIGMSYLGQKILYSQLNASSSTYAERVFTPCKEAGELLRQHNKKLCTLESKTPLNELDIIGFSITHELCYTNVLYMLDLAGIPLRAAARAETNAVLGTAPLVLTGGGCTLNAEPLAPFMDIMVLGEGEVVLPQFIEAYNQAKQLKKTRNEFLKEIALLDGIYIPEFYEPDAHNVLISLYPELPKPTRCVAPDLDVIPYPTEQPVPFGAIHNRLALEIARGCTRGCRFCQAGMLYRPVRERSVKNLTNTLQDCLARTGFDDVSFLSLSTGDFSALKGLFLQTIDHCVAEQIAVSLPSLRVGSIDDSIMSQMANIRRTGATLAPEAGSQRLRDVINKGITEEDIMLHIQKLFEYGWQQVKLYFMIGLPTETDEDLDAIIELCRKVRDAAGKGMPRLQVTAAASPFVPKPNTPFQWDAQDSTEEISRKVFYLRDRCKKEKNVVLRWHEPAMSSLEGIFSRGDRRLADVVETAYLKKNAIFTSWMDSFNYPAWVESMAEHNLSIEEFTGARELDQPLPWDHLESGIDKNFLLRERKKALEAKTTSDCRYTTCHMCGACETKNAKSRLVSYPPGKEICNKLNLPQRDQEAHAPKLNEQGQIIAPEKNKQPPSIAPALVIKAKHYRVWYKKVGDAAYLSQLELQPLFERIMRKTQIPLTFSQGFHPIPLISFGRALPVGVATEADWFSIFIREPLSAPDILQKLHNQLPKGIEISKVEALPLTGKVPQANKEVYTVTYLGNTEALKAAPQDWKTFLEQKEHLWTRETKKGERTADIRPLIVDVQQNSDTTFTITFDWEGLYISPLAIIRVITPNFAIHEILLTKTQQIFE